MYFCLFGKSQTCSRHSILQSTTLNSSHAWFEQIASDELDTPLTRYVK